MTECGDVQPKTGFVWYFEGINKHLLKDDVGIDEICNLLKDDVINENNWNGINKKKAHTFRFIIELMPCTKPMMAFGDANRIIFK